MICFAPVTEVFVFFYFNPLLASQLGAESSGAGVKRLVFMSLADGLGKLHDVPAAPSSLSRLSLI